MLFCSDCVQGSTNLPKQSHTVDLENTVEPSYFHLSGKPTIVQNRGSSKSSSSSVLTVLLYT